MGDLMGRLLNINSVAYHLLSLQGYDVTTRVSEGSVLPGGESAIAEAVARVAARYGHKVVNEVHVLLSLLEAFPTQCESTLASLQKQYHKKFPKGSLRLQKVLQTAIDSKNESLDQRIRHSIEETPFSREKIIAQLQGYLSGKYYPFGEGEWERYMLDRAAQGGTKSPALIGDHSLEGFAAHKLRDSVTCPPRETWEY
jgi:hypothetical protein